MSSENIIKLPRYRKGDLLEIKWEEIVEIKGVKFNATWRRFAYIKDPFADYGIKESDQIRVVANIGDEGVSVSPVADYEMKRIREE